MTYKGRWANGGKGLKNRYVGVRFIIKGKLHYGWLRISVTVDKHKFTDLLTGYAYETIPNKPILTGKTHGPEAGVEPVGLGDSTQEPATLGRLALGARGTSMRRREEGPLASSKKN